MMLALLQVGVPALLAMALGWPLRSRTVKLVQALATATALLAVQRVGLWLDIPWWTAWLMWPVAGLALACGWARTGPGWHVQWRGMIGIAALSAIGLGSGWAAATALLARQEPRGPIVEIAMPLPPGRYIVANGGSRGLTNAHFLTLHPTTERQAAHRGQSFGVDLVGLFPDGRQSRSWRPVDPARYAIFGTPVLAPCAGRVVQRLDGRPDMPVPRVDQSVMAGNHIVLQCGAAQVVVGHLKRGSVAVARGEMVAIGQRLGAVGNSGNSDAPHLHIHAQRPGPAGAILAGEPMPIRIDSRPRVRGERL